jgi:threonine/homoserine/homoserine lactone efflux protein
MQELVALASIVAALAIGVVSPGPSFVMVARVAVASTRRRALAAALGMGVGGAMFGAAALLGLQSVLLAVPALYAGLKIVGGLYLCYLGYLIFRSAPRPLAVAGADGEGSRQGSRGPLRAFWLGVTTQISNPKTAIVYASVFAAFLPASFSTGFAAVLLAAVFLVESAWYALVALLFSSSGPQRAYLSYKSWVDRAAGAVMLGLGLKLVTSAAKP